MKDDDKQYLALLTIIYPNNAEDVFIKTCKRKKIKEDKILIATEEYYKRKAGKESTLGPLEAILFPSSDKLGNVPTFKRYVAFLISEHGCAGASKLLGLSRTTLWRYFYGLGSFGRSDKV